MVVKQIVLPPTESGGETGDIIPAHYKISGKDNRWGTFLRHS